MALSPEWVALKIGQSGSEVPEYSIGEYNSKTSSESITVAEARKEITEKKNEISLYGAYPPDPDKSNTLVVLQENARYESDKFTGSGWRFSGKRFLPASGTGDFLR